MISWHDTHIIMFLKQYFTVFTKNHEIVFLQFQQIKHILQF